MKLAMLSHAVTVGCLLGFWYAAGLGTVFLVGIIVVAVLLIYEHAIVRPDDLTRVNVAFFQVNAIISIGVFLLGVADVLVAG